MNDLPQPPNSTPFVAEPLAVGGEPQDRDQSDGSVQGASRDCSHGLVEVERNGANILALVGKSVEPTGSNQISLTHEGSNMLAGEPGRRIIVGDLDNTAKVQAGLLGCFAPRCSCTARKLV